MKERADPLATEIAARVATLPVYRVPNVRRLSREVSQRMAGEPADVVLEVAVRLARDPKSRPVGHYLVSRHPATWAALDRAAIERIGAGMADWKDVDDFGLEIAGPAWNQGKLRDADIRRWSRSPDRWWRRAALVATVPLNLKTRGGRGDTARTLDICRRLVDDRDDMVVKALSWALRELVKWDAAAVGAFLAEHGDRVAARARRETRNKLETGVKNPKKGR